MKSDFEARYQNNDTPWDHGFVDENLIQIMRDHAIPSGTALDIGCGTGENALWLAQQKFKVTACDLAPTAIKQAKEKAVARNLNIRFLTANILSDPISVVPFSFVFDRGCFHGMPDAERKCAFVEKVEQLLIDGGYWLTLVGNADEPPSEIGPPRLSAAELLAVAEPHFELISLQSGYFGSSQKSPPRCWIGLFRKR